MANEHVNKVVYDGTTLVDLTADTVTVNVMLAGYTAHDASGAPITGAVASMSLPTSASSTASGTQKAEITPTASAQYVNIPTGYNSSSANYKVGAIPSQYIVPSGNLAITENTASGSSLDVTNYATATVNVPAQDSTFVVTVSWNSTSEMWAPDCTYAQVAAAYAAGKEITVQMDPEVSGGGADSKADGAWDTEGSVLIYWVSVYRGDLDNTLEEYYYNLTANGLVLSESYSYIAPEFATPSVTYTPTTSQQTDTITYDSNDYNGIEQVSVTVNAMPTASLHVSASSQFFTESNVRKWRYRGYAEADPSEAGTPGYFSGFASGDWIVRTAVPTGTTVTPTTSAQTIGGANYMMEGAVTVNAIPSQYIVPSGNKEITANGTNIDVASYSTVSVAVETYSDGDELEYGSAPLTDLTGTTWLIDETPPISGFNMFLIDFVSNSTQFQTFNIAQVLYNGLLYTPPEGDMISAYTSSGGWADEDYRTISITGGTDATNATLIAWIQANATQQ